jgi:hypothetical protein
LTAGVVPDPVVRADETSIKMLGATKRVFVWALPLGGLPAPARTPLCVAAMLPPDAVPWDWIRSLTVARHPELAAHAPP